MNNNSLEETKKLNKQSEANKGSGAYSNVGMTSSTSGAPLEETNTIK